MTEFDIILSECGARRLRPVKKGVSNEKDDEKDNVCAPGDLPFPEFDRVHGQRGGCGGDRGAGEAVAAEIAAGSP